MAAGRARVGASPHPAFPPGERRGGSGGCGTGGGALAAASLTAAALAAAPAAAGGRGDGGGRNIGRPAGEEGSCDSSWMEPSSHRRTAACNIARHRGEPAACSSGVSGKTARLALTTCLVRGQCEAVAKERLQ